MPTLTTFVVCDHVLLDPITDKLSLVGVLDRVSPEAMAVDAPEGEAKLLMPQLSLVTFWVGSDDERETTYEQRVVIVASDNKRTDVSDTSNFTITNQVKRVIQPLRVSCRNAGLFRFELYLRKKDDEEWGSLKASYPFILLEPQTREAQPTLFKGHALVAGRHSIA